MKTRTIILVVVGLLLVVATAVSYLVHRSVQSRIGPPHEFALSETPRFLSEELALTIARDTLSRNGYDPAAWQPTRDGHTTAPDGRTVEFMARNAITLNRGVIMFTSTTASARLVSVTLDGSRVVCQTLISK